MIRYSEHHMGDAASSKKTPSLMYQFHVQQEKKVHQQLHLYHHTIMPKVSQYIQDQICLHQVITNCENHNSKRNQTLPTNSMQYHAWQHEGEKTEIKNILVNLVGYIIQFNLTKPQSKLVAVSQFSTILLYRKPYSLQVLWKQVLVSPHLPQDFCFTCFCFIPFP